MKPHTRFYIPNYDIYPTDHQDGHNWGTAVAVRKDIPHHVQIYLLFFQEKQQGSAYRMETL
jgi:hypothetical protein